MSVIKPALTSEEWAHGQIGRGGACVGGGIKIGTNGPYAYIEQAHEGQPRADIIEFRRDDAEMRHAIAALMLNGQRFGFTRDDLLPFRALLGLWKEHPTESKMLERFQRIMRIHAERMATTHEKIEALLPPEGA